jgi:hypothetical protein
MAQSGSAEAAFKRNCGSSAGGDACPCLGEWATPCTAALVGDPDARWCHAKEKHGAWLGELSTLADDVASMKISAEEGDCCPFSRAEGVATSRHLLEEHWQQLQALGVLKHKLCCGAISAELVAAAARAAELKAGAAPETVKCSLCGHKGTASALLHHIAELHGGDLVAAAAAATRKPGKDEQEAPAQSAVCAPQLSPPTPQKVAPATRGIQGEQEQEDVASQEQQQPPLGKGPFLDLGCSYSKDQRLSSIMGHIRVATWNLQVRAVAVQGALSWVSSSRGQPHVCVMP